jgi:hypothetical protein
MAIDTEDMGHAAIQDNTTDSGCKAQTARSQAPDHTTPSMANGVTKKVTQGMANKFANKPTNDT